MAFDKHDFSKTKIKIKKEEMLLKEKENQSKSNQAKFLSNNDVMESIKNQNSAELTMQLNKSVNRYNKLSRNGSKLSKNIFVRRSIMSTTPVLEPIAEINNFMENHENVRPPIMESSQDSLSINQISM